MEFDRDIHIRFPALSFSCLNWFLITDLVPFTTVRIRKHLISHVQTNPSTKTPSYSCFASDKNERKKERKKGRKTEWVNEGMKGWKKERKKKRKKGRKEGRNGKNKAKRCPIDAPSLDVRDFHTNYKDIKILRYNDMKI